MATWKLLNHTPDFEDVSVLSLEAVCPFPGFSLKIQKENIKA